MTRHRSALLMTIVIALAVPAVSEAAVKAGQPCVKAGQVASRSGQRFVCTRVGAQLRWKLVPRAATAPPTPTQVPTPTAPPTPTPTDTATPTPSATPSPTATAEPTPTATATPTPTPSVTQVVFPHVELLTPVAEYRPVSDCRIPNPYPSAGTVIGFPVNPFAVKASRAVRGLLFPIDFSTRVGSSNTESDFGSITSAITQYYADMSDGTVGITWTIWPKYVRMSKSVLEYNLSQRPMGGMNPYSVFMAEARSLMRSSVDQGAFDFVIFAPPPTTTRAEIAAGPAWPATSGADLPATMLDGQSYETRKPAQLMSHELGHLFGLLDLYSFTFSMGEPFESQFPYMGAFELMNYATGQGLELTAWNRWLLGFIPDTAVRCAPSGASRTWLTPVERSGGIKALVLPLSGTRALVVESRRALRHDSALPASASGALVYLVDTSVRPGQGPMRIVRPVGSVDALFRDAPLKLGGTLTAYGYRIEVVESGPEGDVIAVSPAP